jgi:hypothetical protein
VYVTGLRMCAEAGPESDSARSVHGGDEVAAAVLVAVDDDPAEPANTRTQASADRRTSRRVYRLPYFPTTKVPSLSRTPLEM